MQTAGITPAEEKPPGEFIDDNYFAGFHDIFLVAIKKRFGFQAFLQEMDQPGALRRKDIRDAERPLDFFDAGIGRVYDAELFVNDVIFFRLEVSDNPGEDPVVIA